MADGTDEVPQGRRVKLDELKPNRRIIIGNNLMDTTHSTVSDSTDNAKLSYAVTY